MRLAEAVPAAVENYHSTHQGEMQTGASCGRSNQESAVSCSRINTLERTRSLPLQTQATEDIDLKRSKNVYCKLLSTVFNLGHSMSLSISMDGNKHQA
jgi:hypothetical protein